VALKKMDRTAADFKKVAQQFTAEIFVALMVNCAAIWAQSAARINGRVRDATGAVIPGAEIRQFGWRSQLGSTYGSGLIRSC